MILSESEIRKILEPVMAENSGKEIGISVSGSETGSTRFANNAITTNGVYNHLYVTVQANRGQKSGVVQINEWSIEKVREALGRAEALAAVAPENEEFMPQPGPQTYIDIPPVYFASTARCTPERRAQAIATAVESAKSRNLVSAGFFETSSGFTCHLNSKGLFYHYPTSRCYFSTTMRGEGGLSRTRTVWIDKGVIRNLNYTRYWAQKMKTAPVSFPANLVMAGGSKSMDELIRSTENGILVSRLWYIRDLNPMILLLTGLTRDGVFRIENGKITRPINNFRFNESPVQVFKNIVDMAKPERAVGGEIGMSAWVPALKVKEFTFSSISEAV